MSATIRGRAGITNLAVFSPSEGIRSLTPDGFFYRTAAPFLRVRKKSDTHSIISSYQLSTVSLFLKNTLSALFLIFFSGLQASPLIIAHRGASHDAPENTLPAFQLAWKQGADAIEADFLLTKDGHIVCFHDKNAKRTTGANLVIEKSTLEQLRKLDAGAWKGEKFKNTPIPTIGQVLATVPPEKKIVVELKSGPAIVSPLLEVLKASGLNDDQILILSFNPETLKKLKEISPQYQTTWAISIKKDKTGEIKPSTTSMLKTLTDIKADGISTNHNLIPKFLPALLNQRGIDHHVWTVNNQKTIQQLEMMGVKSITTDVPALMRKALTPSVFREDFRENPAHIPINENDTTSPFLTLKRMGPGQDQIKHSHHPEIKNDPHYTWNGKCTAPTLLAFEFNHPLDLSDPNSHLKLQTKNFGKSTLHLAIKSKDQWFARVPPVGQHQDWTISTLPLLGKEITYQKIAADKATLDTKRALPSFQEITAIGFLSAVTPNGSKDCTRLDWFALHSKSAVIQKGKATPTRP